MGLLYPRLLIGQAKPLHEAYRKLTISKLADRVAARHDSAVYVATGGDRVSEPRLMELRGLVVDLAREAGFPDESNRELRAAFDLQLATALHAEMDLVPAEAASGDVWAFLALILLPDVAYWRYPIPPGDRIIGTDLTRHVLGRMWWRAQLVHSSDESDPYAPLKILGEAAFDQIYARRKALGGSPHLVKAILRVWNELDLGELDEREALRDFLKRLLRLAPFVLFEAVGDQALDLELRTAARESVAAMLSTVSGADHDQMAKIDAVFARASGSISNVEPAGVTSVTTDGAPVESVPEVDRKLFTRQAGYSIHTDDSKDRQPKTSPLPYRVYHGPSFGDPRELGLQARADAVAAIVAVEGPVKAIRVFRIITGIAGKRLRDTATDALIDAAKYAVRSKLIEVDNQLGRGGYLGATLRMSDQPEWILRTRGPRDIDEIPDRELVAAASMVQSKICTLDLNELAKKTSLLFGYERSTEPFKAALTDALGRRGR